jgi:urease accessory protein
MSIWERSFSQSLPKAAVETLRPYAAQLRSTSWATTPAPSSSDAGPADDPDVPLVHAHLGPLFGAVARLVGLTLRQAAYVFMLSHVKALVSAAVRASMFGPYQAQKVLGSTEVQRLITHVIDREWETQVEEASQTMPVMDLWFGRHELLYSRIFNS